MTTATEVRTDEQRAEEAYRQVLVSCRNHVANGGKLITSLFGIQVMDDGVLSVAPWADGCCALGAWALDRQVVRGFPVRDVEDAIEKRLGMTQWLPFACGFDGTMPYNTYKTNPFYLAGVRVREACVAEGLMPS